MNGRFSVSLALGLVCSSGVKGDGFVPFSDVEELKPHRIADHCGTETFLGRDGKSQLRHCERYVKKRLEDGGDVELGWSMDVDPDNILSLDTEAEHGVQLLHCTPDALELDLPESHSLHAQEGKVVVGSRFVHGCAHLGDRHLYHRISHVHSLDSRDVLPSGRRFVRARVSTQELPSIAHVVPSLTFHFSWMPEEARSEEAFPKMSTDFGLNRQHLAAKRRLMDFPGDKTNTVVNTGGFQSGVRTNGLMDASKAMVNFLPKQLSNFGWNWDFNMNATQQPTLHMNVPGAKGRWKIRKPFVKVHAGLYLNFSSAFATLTDAPLVQWTWGLKGQGRVQARMLGSLNTTDESGSDPFMAFKIPVLEELETPKWFDKVEFSTGSMPITMEPGYKFSSSMYHKGVFKGALGMGGRTHGWLNPSMSYNSVKGFETTFLGNLTDTNIWPPLWIIFTKSLEMGLQLKPEILMKGDFSDLTRATMKIQMRPYMNFSVHREGEPGSGPAAGAGGAAGAAALGAAGAGQPQAMLTMYPIRVVGMPAVNANKRYKVRITTPTGQEIETSPQANWGQVAYRDHVSNFYVGQQTEKTAAALVAGSTVSLIEVDISGPVPVNTTKGTGKAACDSILSGVCSPMPASISILAPSGMGIATVQMAIALQADPEPWFASRVRGIALSFPQVIIRQDMLAAAAPSSAGTPGAAASGISMHIVQGGQTYVAGLAGTVSGDGDQTTLTGDTVLEFGPRFVDVWKPCPANQPACVSPRLELYAGSTKVAEAKLPGLDFTSDAVIGGTQSGFMKATDTTVPSTVSLTTPGNSAVTVALLTLHSKVVPTLSSSMFLSPRPAEQVPMATPQTIKWTVAEVDPTKEYEFTLEAFALERPSAQNILSYANYHQVNGQVLLPVASKRNFKATCTPMMPGQQNGPCVFSTDFSFQGASFSDGMAVSLVVEWSEGSAKHQLFSPYVSIGGSVELGGIAAARRRLSEPLGAAAAAPRELWSRDAWDARIDKHSKMCNKKDLSFTMGSGIRARGVVDGGMTVPTAYPVVGSGDEDDEPGLTTPWKDIMQANPKKDAEDIFGGKDGALCQMGLCAGLLPGCSKGGNTSMHIPRLVFNFNRPYYFGNQTKGAMSSMMQRAMAYAFSTMPEALDVAVAQFQAKPTQPPTQPTLAAPTQAPEEWWTHQKDSTLQQPAFPQEVTPTAAPESDSLTDAFNKWWGGATSSRRLHGEERPLTEVGDADTLPEELEPHQVRVVFHKGTNWIIDRPFVEMMKVSGRFQSLEDVEDDLYHTHGPLQITSFYVDSDVRDLAARREAQRRDAADAAAVAGLGAATGFASLFLAAAGTVSLVVFFALRRRGGLAEPMHMALPEEGLE